MTQALSFWTADRGAATSRWLRDYEESAVAPYRQIVTDLVGRFTTTGLVFEAGCHCGPQLAHLLTAYSGLTAEGVDCNESAVLRARSYLAPFGERVNVRCGGILPMMTAMIPLSVDVVVSCYAVAYLSPREASEFLEESWRIARRGVVMLEPGGSGEYLTRGQYVEWRHDYGALLSQSKASCWDKYDVKPVTRGLDTAIVISHEG